MALDASVIGSIINGTVNVLASSMSLGATIHTNQTGQAIAAAQNAAATQQNNQNNKTAVQLAQEAARQQQQLLNYEYNSQKLGQSGAIPWMWLIGGIFFFGLLGFIGYKAFK